jgi:hypothetical protein
VSGVGEGLARMVARGLMTLEQLDQPTLGWAELERDRERSSSSALSEGWPGRRGPAMAYPGAGTARPVRNLAREWIEANPRAWAAMLEQPAPWHADQLPARPARPDAAA